MPYTQTDRTLEIQTTLGTDLAMLTELEGEERISQPFLFNIRFVTDQGPGAVSALLGSAVTIKFGWPEPYGLERRPLHGHIRRLRRGMVARGGEYEWHAEIVPMLWFLSRTSDCRIFQDKSIPDIIEEVLQLHGVTSFEKKLLGSYQPREYVVQYRESALDFIQRLMEQEGIFYWHEHTDGGHKLVFADDNVSTPAKGSYAFLGKEALDSVMSLDEEIVVRSGKWTLRDFNFKTPSTLLEATQPTTINVAEMKKRERYDYPGIYEDAGAGGGVARHRIENEETFHKVLTGTSGVSDFVAGARVTIPLTGDSDLLLTEVRHEAQDYSHWTDEAWDERERERGGRPRGRAPFYANAFVAIPKAVKYRPERVTPRPFVQGPQTAIVTGTAGEEIHTDEYGRVKVQFHWDRLGQKDEHTSCWIRVSQGWAGKSWGQMHIPRIGHEVIVDFLEGDPDRPIITGRVYNAENTVPYALPANKTQSGIKSNSSKGGGGSNEIRFEDKKGSEEIFVNAEHDLNSIVENNETRKVGEKGTGDRTTTIKNNETHTIGGNKKTDVTGNFEETIKGTETRKVNGNVSETYMANETRNITGSVTESVTGSVTETITGSLTQTVTGGITITTPASIMITAVGGFTMVAPAGTKTVDSFFDKTGGFTADAFGSKLSIVANKNDMVGILALSVINNKVDLVKSKVDISATVFKNKPTEIQTGGQAIRQAALNCHFIGVFLIA